MNKLKSKVKTKDARSENRKFIAESNKRGGCGHGPEYGVIICAKCGRPR